MTLEFNHNIILDNVTLFFSNLHKLEGFEGSEPKYTGKFLLDPANKEHMKFIKSVETLALGVKINKNKLDDRTCIKNTEYEGQPQIIFTASNRKKLTFWNRKGDIFTPDTADTPFLRGCTVNILISLWHQTTRQTRVNANLYGVRFVDEGTSVRYGGMTEDDMALMSRDLGNTTDEKEDDDLEFDR